MYIVQSVLFDNSIWSVVDSANWLLNHDYKVLKIDETNNFIRYRQISPVILKRRGYTQFKNKKLGNGIELIIAYKTNKHFDTI